MTFDTKITPYGTYEFDLSSARINEALGITGMANSLVVISAPSAFSIRLNETTNDLLAIAKGFKINGISITEVYITNDVGSGTGKITLAWLS